MTDQTNHWGGKRQGAGRKCQPETLATVVKRVPKALVPMLDNAIVQLKRQQRLACQQDVVLPEQIFKLLPSNLLQQTAANIPLATEKIPAGMPSPIETHVEEYVDLNRYLVEHPEHTFMARAGGDSMQDAGIDKEDLLIIDRSLTPRHRDIVMADTGNDFTIKRLHLHATHFELHPENMQADYPILKPQADEQWQIVGVVTSIIKTLR